jgi:hypothetical protein
MRFIKMLGVLLGGFIVLSLIASLSDGIDSSVAVLALALVLGFIPGIIARRRNHRNATAIAVCGFFFFPVGLIWALTDNCDPIVETAPEADCYTTGSLSLLQEDAPVQPQASILGLR